MMLVSRTDISAQEQLSKARTCNSTVFNHYIQQCRRVADLSCWRNWSRRRDL